jgi:deoxyribose-phosphate aldolase
MEFTYEQVAKTIDHSLLNPTLTTADMEAGCELALGYNVASVCILPYYVRRCSEILHGSTVVPSTTIGFPHGAHTTTAKLAEAERALADGAVELDAVVNISKVLSRDYAYVAAEVAQLSGLIHGAGAKLKVIFENCYLNAEQKIALCRLCTEAKVDWVKTSTGYGTGGATIEDLELMLQHVGPGVQVKAAGGVRDIDTLLAIMSLGVTRCGATRTKTMLDEYRVRLGLSLLAMSARGTH